MYELQFHDYDYGWVTKSSSQDLQSTLSSYELACEDWREGKIPEVVNVRLVLVLRQDHP